MNLKSGPNLQSRRISLFSHSLPPTNPSSILRKFSSPDSLSLGFPTSFSCSSSIAVAPPIRKCFSLKTSDSSSQPDPIHPSPLQLVVDQDQEENIPVKILKGANSIIVLATTILALIYPPSFTWFATSLYAPAIGFLMFAVGVNSSEKDFTEAFNRSGAIFAGYVGQFVIKPILGYLFGTISVTALGLPTYLGAGIMLTSCVSGAQLSNCATFLTDPAMAPLSIVMTSLSTATAVIVTPLLSLLLIGKSLPVDVRLMVSSIMQIVIAPIAAGLILNRFLPWVCAVIRPLLLPLSVFVTALCVGSSLAITIADIAFHIASDVKALQRTETGMQSSLLKFFQDPLVGVPPAIPVVIMALIGFSLVMLWAIRKSKLLRDASSTNLSATLRGLPKLPSGTLKMGLLSDCLEPQKLEVFNSGIPDRYS